MRSVSQREMCGVSASGTGELRRFASHNRKRRDTQIKSDVRCFAVSKVQ